MPKSIFDDDSPLFDYGAIDEMSAMGIGDRGYANAIPASGDDQIFDDQFNRRASEIQRSPSSLKPIHIVPQKKGPWSGNPQLGIEQGFGASSNNEQTILKLDEWDFPYVTSIMLGIDYTADNPDTTRPFGIQAIINAGVGGCTQEFVVDWVEGTVIRASFNALNVIARYILNPGASVPETLRLRVSLARGSIPGKPPTYTDLFYPAVSNAGGEVNGRIPKFAKRLFVQGNAQGAVNFIYSANASYEMSSLASPAGGSIFSFTGAQLLSWPNGIPIPNAARYFRSTYTGVGTLTVIPVYELAL